MFIPVSKIGILSTTFLNKSIQIPIAPIIANLIVVGDEISLAVSGPSTLYGVLTAAATQPTGAQIKAGLNAAGTAAGFAFNYSVENGANVDQPFAGAPSGTWYLHIVADNGLLSNVLTLGETMVLSTGYKENWSTYANGNTWTQVDAQYSRSSAIVAVTINTDASAPGGLSAAWGKASGNHEWAWRDDIATALAARTNERVQFLLKQRLTTAANTRGGFGYSSAADVHTGMLAQRFSNVNHSIALQLAGNPSSSTNSAALLSNRSDGDIIWTRVEIDGQYIKGRSWVDGNSEPGTWTSTLDNITPIALTFIGPTIRTGGLGAHQFLYYSVGIGADAPGP